LSAAVLWHIIYFRHSFNYPEFVLKENIAFNPWASAYPDQENSSTISLSKMRHCFFNADKAKMANSEYASATALHIEASINTYNNIPNNQSGLYCQYRFFAVKLRF